MAARPGVESFELAPVSSVAGNVERAPEQGVALCLSGGGGRAMLFHAGALLRLNELGLLAQLDRVSSVSGGSITAGALAVAWADLDFDDARRATNLTTLVVDPLRALARQRVDVAAFLRGLLPGTSPARELARVLDHALYHGARLADLPDDPPRFVFNAANLASGVLWRFSKPYMRDYRVGEVRDPDLALSIAVAASAAFPPFFSPLRLAVDPTSYTPGSGSLTDPRYQREPALADGGVYDNLGLETAWKRYRTILVSDGGGHLGDDPRPPGDLLRQPVRVMQAIDGQVRALRKRLLIDGYRSGLRDGAYWGIRSNIADYHVADALPCPADATQLLADEPTRLTRMPRRTQERLINWGYAVTDAALRAHVRREASAPGGFPYPTAGVGG
jgi:NTE family protein